MQVWSSGQQSDVPWPWHSSYNHNPRLARSSCCRKRRESPEDQHPQQSYCTTLGAWPWAIHPSSKVFSVSDSFLFCSPPSSQALGCPSSQSQHRDPGCVQGHPDEAEGLRSPRVFPGRFLKLTRSQYICLLFGESSCWRGPSLCPVIANPLTRMSKKTGDSDRDLGHGVGGGGEKREAVFSLYVLLQLFLTMYMHLLLKNEK